MSKPQETLPRTILKDRQALNIHCGKCTFSHLCLSKDLTDEETEKLNRLITKAYVLEKGMHIYRQNDKMSYLYAIREGYCKDYLLDIEGNERIDNFYFPGDMLALESIPLKKFSFSAVALTKMQICAIPVDAFFDLMRTIPNLLRRFVNIGSYKMQNDRHIRMNTNAKQRVADFLLNILHRSTERQLTPGYIHLAMSQFDISNLLGMAYETVSRILHDMQNQQIIRIANKDIHVLNLTLLQSLSSSVMLENIVQAA